MFMFLYCKDFFKLVLKADCRSDQGCSLWRITGKTFQQSQKNCIFFFTAPAEYKPLAALLIYVMFVFSVLPELFCKSCESGFIMFCSQVNSPCSYGFPLIHVLNLWPEGQIWPLLTLYRTPPTPQDIFNVKYI